MKTNSKAKKQKASHLSFYLVLILCMMMISVSCWFAYSQTKNQLVLDIDSVTDMKVMEMETAIPRETIRPTEPPTEPETEAPTIPKLVASIQPLETAPTETQPLTQQAAVIDAPETAPEVIQDTTEPELIQTAAESPCWPLQGEVLEAFSNGELVKSSTTGIWQTHNGIDIAGTLGDTICAVNTGKVRSVENNALWGVTVTIEHQNGMVSRYCNLNSGLSVSEGEKIEKGAVIGALGDTADIESSMQTHLHFEVLQGDNYIDPVSYLGSPEVAE